MIQVQALNFKYYWIMFTAIIVIVIGIVVFTVKEIKKEIENCEEQK